MKQYSARKIFTEPIEGIFLAGPYILEGRLMWVMEHLRKELPMMVLRIRPGVPGTTWGDLYAPFALLNTHWLHGWEEIG